MSFSGFSPESSSKAASTSAATSKSNNNNDDINDLNNQVASGSSNTHTAASSSSNNNNNNNNNNNSSDIYSNNSLLEQLIYVETFMPELDGPGVNSAGSNTQMEDDLSSFVDNSFIFTDEDKPKFDGFNSDKDKSPVNPNDFHDSNHNDHNNNNNNNNNNNSNNNNSNNNNNDNNPNLPNNQVRFSPSSIHSNIISGLPNNNTDLFGIQIPMGAKSSLEKAGLTNEQISLLASLVSQHQNGVPATTTAAAVQPSLPSLSAALQHNNHVHGTASNNGNDRHPNQLLPPPNSFYQRPDIFQHQPQLQQQQPPPQQQSYAPSPSSSVGSGSTSPATITTTPSQVFVAARTPGSSFSGPSGVPQFNGPFDSNSLSSSSDAALSPANQANVSTDKRRRNTAASARFRIKKKLKEQKLERDVKDLKELASSLELKIKNLSLENLLLKNLIVEKNNRKSLEEVGMMKKKALGKFADDE